MTAVIVLKTMLMFLMFDFLDIFFISVNNLFIAEKQVCNSIKHADIFETF